MLYFIDNPRGYGTQEWFLKFDLPYSREIYNELYKSLVGTASNIPHDSCYILTDKIF